MYSYGPLHIAEQKQGDQLEPTYSSSVRIQGVALRTCRKRWMIGRGGERGSGISMLAARQDYDDKFASFFFYTQLNVKKVLFQTIQFSISIQFSSIWPIDWVLSGATTPAQRGPGSDGNTLHSLKLLHYWNLTIRWFRVKIQDTRWGSLTPLQRCSRCFLRPKPTGSLVGRAPLQRCCWCILRLQLTGLLSTVWCKWIQAMILSLYKMQTASSRC